MLRLFQVCLHHAACIVCTCNVSEVALLLVKKASSTGNYQSVSAELACKNSFDGFVLHRLFVVLDVRHDIDALLDVITC